MSKWMMCGALLVVGAAAMSARAQWGYPPPGYRPPVVVQPDGTLAPCADRYGLCAAWKRKHGVSSDGACDKPSFVDRVRARCGLGGTP